MWAITPPDRISQDVKWTVMIFMGVATFKGNARLIEAAEADLAEMRSVGSGGGLNIFVQVHDGKSTPRRGHIKTDTPTKIDALDPVPEREQESAEGFALRSFISWSLEHAGYGPKDSGSHYSMLVMWGHAYDFAIGREVRSDGAVDALDFTQLSRVLESLQEEFKAPGAKLDILGFDACDVATVELACQIEPFAKHLLGSQIGVPIPGWPYDRILDRLRNPKVRIMAPSEFGSYAVRRFCESYNAATDTVSLTLLDLKRARELLVFAKFLALALMNSINDPDSRDRIAYVFSQSQTGVNKPFVDVADLCFNLVRTSGDPLGIEAATALGDFLISPQPPLVGNSEFGRGRPFVVDHGRNAGQAARLNGISIYAPHVAPDTDFYALRPLYDSFVFAQRTQWSELVHALARMS
jgi:cysteine peptidase C11 family protein